MIAELARNEIDLASLVSEFVKPSCERGVLVTGSIPWQVANEVSDLDVMVLLPSADAIKTRRTRTIAGNVVNYLPSPAANWAGITLFLSGIEIDLALVINPAVTHDAIATATDVRVRDHEFLTRLATGWIVHGAPVVEQWRRYYGSDTMRARWIRRELTSAVLAMKSLATRMDAPPGSVPALGRHIANCLLRALMADEGRYCPSLKWLLGVNQLIATAAPDLRDLLIAGRALAFPSLFDGAGDEQAYVATLSGYCVRVRQRLSRDETLAGVVISIMANGELLA